MTSKRQSIVRGALMLAVVALAAAATGTARASQLLERNASHETLQTNSKGEALVTASVAGKTVHVLVWGAENALTPKKGAQQVHFNVDYTGGYGKYHNAKYWQTFGGSCGAYDGPALAWKVTACKASDGSYWALQAWQRALPDYGATGTATQRVWELRISHWTGPMAVLSIQSDWSYRKYDQIFGTYMYGNTGIYGFSSTSAGNPLDSFGRNVYVDSFNGTYGKGWQRVNSFLTHQAGGSFCYGFFPHGPHGTGQGAEYRATAEGPGVMPDVMWQGASPGTYNKDADANANAAIKALGDSHCRPN